jgi:KUP system potassium uptake protein
MLIGLAALVAVIALIAVIERRYKKKEATVLRWAATMAALGVVFGDIGTSPLYTFNETFFHAVDGEPHQILQFSPDNVKGVVSLVFWTLFVVMCMKYATMVMTVHYHEEGGPFALLALLNPFAKKSRFVAFLVGTGLVISTCFLIGEGLITPPISCLSAVEGLKVLWPQTEPWVVPIVLVIFLGLFSIQRFGTQNLGTIFGYTTFAWFLTIGSLGAVHIWRNPEILEGLNPTYAVFFLVNNGFKGSIVVLGAIVLCMTGGEALYADRGHFGRAPIVGAWYRIALPCLLLSYFGQGAYLLGNGEVTGGNIFYSSANSLLPTFAQPILVLLATCATIIASQALISGVFSLISVARSQDYVPPHTVTNTSDEHHPMKGQVYIQSVNWGLFTGCCALVLIFRSSSNLAAAYGLAVTGVMTITTLSMIAVARHIWQWAWWKIALVFGAFLIVDLAYFGANAVKFIHGGYVPFAIGLVLFAFLKNRKSVRSTLIAPALQDFTRSSMHQLKQLVEAKDEELRNIGLVKGSQGVLVLTSRRIDNYDSPIPAALLGYVIQQRLVPRSALFLHVAQTDVPDTSEERYLVDKGNGLYLLTVQYGFREVPDLEAVERVVELEYAMRDPMILVGDEEIIVSPEVSFLTRLWVKLYIAVHRNARKVYQFLYPHGGYRVEGRVIKIHIPILITVEDGKVKSKVMLTVPNLALGNNGVAHPIVRGTSEVVGV